MSFNFIHLFLFAGLWAFSFILLFILFKPLLKNKNHKKLFFKFYIGFAAVSVAAYFLIAYFDKEPDFFSDAIEQLHSNSFVRQKIGSFSSYSLNNDSLPKNPINTAKFRVDLIGDSLTISLECTMKKKQSKWLIENIVEDTLVKN